MKNPFETAPEIVPKSIQKGEIVPKSIQKDEEELEEPEEVEEEVIEGELVEPIKLEFDPISKDQTFTGDVFVAPVPLLHLEYNFQLGDTFMVESKNPKNSEVIFVGAKTNFSLFDPSNFDMFNVGDIYKVVNRNVDVKGRPYDYNITFERTRRK